MTSCFGKVDPTGFFNKFKKFYRSIFQRKPSTNFQTPVFLANMTSKLCIVRASLIVKTNEEW